MKLKKELVLRSVAGEDILVPVGKDAARTECIFSLNETSAAAFRALLNGGGEAEMVGAVLNEFDVDEATAVRDIKDFIKKLEELEII